MKHLRPALSALVLFTLITGLAYPALVTGLAQVFFPDQANGSLIQQNGKLVGSALIGQEFKKPEYFWGRLSATGDHAYNGLASGGSNLSTGNPALSDAARARITELKKYPVPTGGVPVDLVTASGSGLDPHITPAAALYQVPRVAAQRHLAPEHLEKLIREETQMPLAGVIGEPQVNVLALNLAVDKLSAR